MKNLLKLSLLASAVAYTAPASADDLSVSVSVDYVTEYVFRGVSLAGEAVQPGVELSYGNWTVGAWGSAALGEESVFFDDEIDIYGSYSFSLSESISADVGATLYHYPQYGGLLDIGTDDGDASTLEIFAGLGFDAPLEPSVTAYYDLTLEAFTLEGGAGYSFPLGEKSSFDVGATAGAVMVDGDGDYQYGQLSGAFNYGFTDTASAYVGVNFGHSSEDTFSDISFEIDDLTSIDDPDSSSVWLGFGVTAGF